MSLIETAIDTADPLTLARHIVLNPAVISGTPNPPRNVLLVEALWDELVANEGSEALARAAGMPLASPNVGPNAGVDLAVADGVLRGFPVETATALLVQASPATHGSDLYNAHGLRHYRPPFGVDALDPFPALPADIPVREPYLGLQQSMVSFFASAFAGGVPTVDDLPVPVRDFDDDGREDATDSDPFDPAQ